MSGPSGVPPEGRAPAWCLIDVVVFLDRRAGSARAVEWAASLAREQDAGLTGVLVEPPLTSSPAAPSADGDAVREAEPRACFEAAVLRHRIIRWEWREVRGCAAPQLAVHGRGGDLTVMAGEDPSEPADALRGLREFLMAASNRPTAILPSGALAQSRRRILLAWSDGAGATRAVAGAMPLLLRADAVEVLQIAERESSPPLGSERAADVAELLARDGARVDLRTLTASRQDAGGTLLSRATALGADLIVMGVQGHSRRTQSGWLGDLAGAVLATAAVPVLICR